ALEIAAQASVGRRSLERVAGKREMIEPDGAITGSDELPMTELRHRKTLCLPGQRSLVDAALPRDQMRDVGIPEQRDAVGSEILRAVERVGQVVARLAWQPVHQVEVERTDASATEQVDAALDHPQRLDAPNRLLEARSERLHAHACVSCAGRLDNWAPVVGERTRVELDRD